MTIRLLTRRMSAPNNSTLNYCRFKVMGNISFQWFIGPKWPHEEWKRSIKRINRAATNYHIRYLFYHYLSEFNYTLINNNAMFNNVFKCIGTSFLLWWLTSRNSSRDQFNGTWFFQNWLYYHYIDLAQIPHSRITTRGMNENIRIILDNHHGSITKLSCVFYGYSYNIPDFN